MRSTDTIADGGQWKKKKTKQNTIRSHNNNNEGGKKIEKLKTAIKGGGDGPPAAVRVGPARTTAATVTPLNL